MNKLHTLLLFVFIITSMNVKPINGTGSGEADFTPYFYQISGSTPVADYTYLNGSSLTIEYRCDLESSSLMMVVDGGSYENESIEMEYISRTDDYLKYRLIIEISGYTTFYAYELLLDKTIGELELVVENEMGLKYNRLWTVDEKPPELLEVINATLDPTQGRLDYIKNSDNISIKYMISSNISDPITLYYGYHYNLLKSNKVEMEYKYQDAGRRYYEYNMSVTSRELWFTAYSVNSYEYDRNVPRSYNRHRLSNGFIVINALINSERSGRVNESVRVTENDDIRIYVEVLNETGVEQINVTGRVLTNREGQTINAPVLVNTEFMSQYIVNGSMVSLYKLTLPRIEWGSSITVIVGFIDTSLNLMIKYQYEMTFEVSKWGPISYFEHDVIYTKSGQISLDIVVNDIAGVGLRSITVSSPYEEKNVPIGQYNVELSMGEYYGYQYVIMNATNMADESTLTYLPVYFDITKPIIEGITIIPELGRNRVEVLIKDNELNGTAIKSIQIESSGAKFAVEEVYNKTEVRVNENISFRPGNNTIIITAEDMAGNIQVVTVYHYIEKQIETENKKSVIMFDVVIIGMVVIAYVHLRRES